MKPIITRKNKEKSTNIYGVEECIHCIHALRNKTHQVPAEEEENGDYNSSGYNSQYDIGESDEHEMMILCTEKTVPMKEKIA